MKKELILFFGIIAYSLAVIAQNDSIPQIITDRPTQSASPYLVPKGSFQIESGVVYTNMEDDIDIMEMWSIGNTMLRYGIYDNFEVRLSGSFESYNTQVKNSEIDSSYSGMGPVTAGFKVFIVEEKGIRPEIAIVGSITFRHLGSEYFYPTYSYPTGLLAMNHNITKRLSFGYNVGFAYDGEGKSDGFFTYSGFFGYTISKRFWSFAEIYGNFDNADLPNHKVDAGLTYVIRNNLQLDVSGGFGLATDVTQYFVSAGLSWRVPR